MENISSFGVTQSLLHCVYFMLAVTGIPPTEAQALRSRGDDYRRYQRATNAFFPWFPRRVDHTEQAETR